MKSSSAHFQRLPARRGFSLIEVIMALGILAVSIVSIIGLIGPTLNSVKEAQDLNAGTSAIAKMNAVLDSSVFYNDDTPSESVYTWVYKSTSIAPTVFIFYDEIPGNTSPNVVATPVQRVVRYSKDVTLISPSTKVVGNMQSQGNYGISPFSTFVSDVLQSRISGSVIAMTVSLSPLVQNFPVVQQNGFTEGGSNGWYKAPPSGGLFPDNLNMPDHPDKPSPVGTANYAEGYLPILVQAFVLPLDSVVDNNYDPTGDLIMSNRIFTYTTAKLR